MMLKLQEQLSTSHIKQLDHIRDFMRRVKRVCIAYSGGVDSSLVAAIAEEQLGANALAITGVSPSLAPHLLEEARFQADWIGIKHEECQTNELADPNYSKNPKNRCFACKKELHSHLFIIAKILCLPLVTELFVTSIGFSFKKILISLSDIISNDS